MTKPIQTKSEAHQRYLYNFTAQNPSDGRSAPLTPPAKAPSQQVLGAFLWVIFGNGSIGIAMTPNRAKQLQTALAHRDLIRVTRGFDDVTVKGYVLAVGRAYFLVALVSDQLRFDGFACLRVKDLKSIEVDPYRVFSEAALKQRGLRRPKVPRLTLDTAKTILESARAICPLVTLHREEVDPEVCHIGQVVGTNRTQVALLQISAHAHWDLTPTRYPLREITRIDFGGGYEEALLLVGGESGVTPSLSRPKSKRSVSSVG